MLRHGILAFSCMTMLAAGCDEPVSESKGDTQLDTTVLSANDNQTQYSKTPFDALDRFYNGYDYAVPRAPSGPEWPHQQSVINSIAFGSCHSTSPDRDFSILNQIAAENHNMFIYTGDNVYGDAYAFDASLPELREAYHQLASKPEFRALRTSTPMLAVWDDHDYGMNDKGRTFAFKRFAETLFLDFWNASDNDIRRSRDGIYDSHVFGPDGQRVQIILLDTRYFRSDLTPTDERGVQGRERYIPSSDPEQDMLGAAQWAWLEDQLLVPADLRLLVSSIQVHAEGHGWEAWKTMPLERNRLYRLIESTEANGVVIVSGDRHSSGLYVRDNIASYPIYEVTSSSLNMSFADENNEPGPYRIGEMYAPVNYGVINIDWSTDNLSLQIKDDKGGVVREQTIKLNEIASR